ncbi:hypothetical protein [Dyella sp. GSA-30]|uniref:hypothetical protein n=1 Tax=Dyella sp. GSA-30 TaxID=2994496 RepID=UPI00248FBFA8|nr:hypothetical protein [Dyella sp. GSA-30]BDU22098.1 hypothetical protein DYGSA30_35550 [Dyella sp. GSA-30]
MPKAESGAAERRRERAASAAPYEPRRSGRINGPPISKEAYRATIDLGNAQPTINMHGGVGIPGGRTLNDVLAFQPLKFNKLGKELGAILKTSKELRKQRDAGGTIDEARLKVAEVNRKIEYPGKQIGAHSLHVGNDIAAVWNNSKSKVYDYPDLAQSLDKRLASPKNAKDSKKVYWNSKKPEDERRGHVADGLQHLIAGKPDQAHAAFGQAGLTQRGMKWAYKMGSLMLAERGRELSGGGGKQVHTALDHVKGNADTAARSFTDVFVKNAASLAPFAQRGGAKTLK